VVAISSNSTMSFMVFLDDGDVLMQKQSCHENRETCLCMAQGFTVCQG